MKSSLNKYMAFVGLISLSLISCAVQQQQPRKIQVVKQSETTTTQPTKATTLPTKEIGTDTYRTELPEVKREFRAAWIATVANINWPSSKNLSTQEQKNEAIKILDLLQDTNFNAVVFQVRPAADALYKSNLEPWSYYLTGQTGQSPSPYYDPLEFWIDEAHKRGMELHVWLNPYRAHHLSGGSVSSESMVRKSPNNIVKLKNGMYWFDPASTQTQDHVSKVVKDIVSRYDIDAVHFDDYFYPYASYNGGADFPDTASWNAYKNNNGSLSKADWRRSQVNTFIERINKEIKETKSYVKFGISPFGIWKSGYPDGVVGSSQYDELYADAKLWLNKGWVDYFAPQLYWPINSQRQNFQDLLEWWQDENTMNRHLWPGLNTVEIKANNKATEIVNQIKITNQVLNKKSVGAIHYSVAGLLNNREMVTELKNGPYKEKALIPASPWMKIDKLPKPTIKIQNDTQDALVSWNIDDVSKVFQWVVFTKYNNDWTYEIVNHNTYTTRIAKTKNGKSLNAVAVKAIDRLGNESDYVAKKL
ncbi:family 10 glycosylhydrolase [Flavobacterium sp. xlx-214]|uniref:glycoside hydrolase family 10 protein n=1 Tax=unclassified Flavobacterium TaxID=196869 RepID=UPI0013D71F39|nr:MULTISPECIES: family 10 glycosylhydrolase [unclassified Flavobacterium]MBA5792636.1 family 10 glycosylhydrolase [Flavobacterium sp. xlx-221]QMI83785.1 family 10 glycosylhydrolase [Flavobacterium sp. xlx-214]